ncbi:MAG: hypothetical protein J0M08_03765 [Bacteroidetes bacterium]|nr:hypothetical protein [Bacteroidota bacterium]
MSAQTTKIDSAIIKKWIDTNLELDAIKKSMLALEMDNESIELHIAHYKKTKNSQRQFVGFIWLGIGAFMGFLSCILSILNPIPDLYNWILYGFTTISIILIFVGLYFLFE